MIDVPGPAHAAALQGVPDTIAMQSLGSSRASVNTVADEPAGDVTRALHRPINFAAHPLLRACMQGDVEECRKHMQDDRILVNQHLQWGKRQKLPLEIACAYGQTEVVKTLLENSAGRRPDVQAEHLVTALCTASFAAHADEQLLALLLASGASVDGKTGKGETPLMLTMRKRNPQHIGHCTEQLLAHGANVNARDPAGLTPLAFATICNVPTPVVLQLLRGGAQVNSKDQFGFTPLIYAVWHRNLALVQLLVDKGATVSEKGAYRLQAVDRGKKLVSALRIVPQLNDSPLSLARRKKPERCPDPRSADQTAKFREWQKMLTVLEQALSVCEPAGATGGDAA